MSEINRSQKILEIPDFYPPVLPIEGEPQIPLKSEFTIPELKDQLGSTTEAFIFNPEFMVELGLDRYLLKSAHFTEVSEWKAGREDSFHQVFFGELELIVDKGPNGESAVIPVAIKPYFTAKRLAIHEYVAQGLINQQRNMETFHPIGFWTQDNKSVFLLTRFEEDVKTLDNVNWMLGGEDELNVHLEPFAALRACAKALALMHSKGFVHRDAQIKNMGVDSNGIRIVDLQQMRRFSLSDFGYDTESRLMVSGDFQKLTESVIERSYLSDFNSTKKRQIIDSNLITPYLSMMRHPSLSFAGDTEFHRVLNSIAETALEHI
jgi:tRNA A-37 threonylcarbamoyl transferase component Bud32